MLDPTSSSKPVRLSRELRRAAARRAFRRRLIPRRRRSGKTPRYAERSCVETATVELYAPRTSAFAAASRSDPGRPPGYDRCVSDVTSERPGATVAAPEPPPLQPELPRDADDVVVVIR